MQAQSVQLQDETTLLVAITKNSLVPSLASVEIVPTTPIFTPAIDNITLQDAVNEAWQKRPELQQANLNLKNADIEVRATKNALLPAVNLFGLYEAQGLGGVQNTNVLTPTGPSWPVSRSCQRLVAQEPWVRLVSGGIHFHAQITPSLFVFPGGLGDDCSRLSLRNIRLSRAESILRFRFATAQLRRQAPRLCSTRGSSRFSTSKPRTRSSSQCATL